MLKPISQIESLRKLKGTVPSFLPSAHSNLRRVRSMTILMQFFQQMKSLIIISVAAVLFSSCSSPFSSSAGMAPDAAYSKRQIQRSGTINMKSRSLESSSKKSIALVAHHQAIITSSSLTDDRFKATIRVPSNSLPSLMQSLESVGKVTSSQVSMDDITAAYLDLEASLKNKSAPRGPFILKPHFFKTFRKFRENKTKSSEQ